MTSDDTAASAGLDTELDNRPAGISTAAALFYIGFFIAVIGIALKAIAQMLAESGGNVPDAVAPVGTVLLIGGLGFACLCLAIEAIGTVVRRR